MSATVHEGLEHAYRAAVIGRDEGGVPIGSALMHEGRVIATGYNRRVQQDSATRHAEVDCVEQAGRLPSAVYREATLYTTLSPCYMCAGTIVHHRIPRVVIGENRTYSETEEWLRSHGVEVLVVDDPACRDLMERFATENPELWAEDSGRE
ncbi:MAG: nucleoside deaminase [Actinomycetota bacterium]|nr:nucleoside deaminase [Actinomycetota bacterium]